MYDRHSLRGIRHCLGSSILHPYHHRHLQHHQHPASIIPTIPPHLPQMAEVELVHPPSPALHSSNSVAATTGAIIDQLRRGMDLQAGSVPVPTHHGDTLIVVRVTVTVMMGWMGRPRDLPDQGTRYSHRVLRNDIITLLRPSRANRIPIPSRWLHTSGSRSSLIIPLLPLPSPSPAPTLPAHVLLLLPHRPPPPPPNPSP
jgi:hypothetical protein